jgi:hypothetical protein
MRKERARHATGIVQNRHFLKATNMHKTPPFSLFYHNQHKKANLFWKIEKYFSIP